MTTLLRAVTNAGGLARRKAFAAIREGRVTVAGVTRTNPSEPYAGGALVLDGESLSLRQTVHTYLIMNKPPGFITTVSDERGRRTVLDLVPAGLRAPGLHPVGRLDRDTTGLLLLTTDGDFTYALTHPKHEVEKEYWVRLDPPATAPQLAQLRAGIELDGKLHRALRIRRLVGSDPFELSITLQEGRNRQVRRMVEATGAQVLALRRVREGSVTLERLPEGAVRALTEGEVAALRE